MAVGLRLGTIVKERARGAGRARRRRQAQVAAEAARDGVM